MKEEQVFFNPFRMLSPKLDAEASRIARLHEEQVQESITFDSGLLMMISKIIAITRLLAKSVHYVSPEALDRCEALAGQVHDQEKVLTRNLVSSDLPGDIIKGLIRFPYRLERIGDLLESIIRCFRIKERDSVQFGEKAHQEIDRILASLLDMMINLKDALQLPNKVILEAVASEGGKVAEMIEDFKVAHWERLETGFAAVESSSIYRDILDSSKGVEEYLVKMADTMLELGRRSAGAPEPG